MKAALHWAGLPPQLISTFEPTAPPTRKCEFQKPTSPGLLPAMFTSNKVQPSICVLAIMVERYDLGYFTLKNICHSEQHIRELSNAIITRIAHLDHRDRGRWVVEVAASSRDGGPNLANYSAASWEEDRVSNNVGTGWEKQNFATSISSSNVIEISGIVCSSISIYWVSGDVLNIDKLSHIIRLIRRWWKSLIFPIRAQ